MSAENALNEILILAAARNKIPKLLTVKEAAKYLAVSERTVRRLIEFQKIPVAKLDDSIMRLNVDDLREYVKDCTQPEGNPCNTWREEHPHKKFTHFL
ncbi:MAG: helix-turn-helix domain-containing protein [Vulcanimicrobiota bacterium]